MVISRYAMRPDVIVLAPYEVGSWKRGGEFARKLLQLKHGVDEAVEFFATWLLEVVPRDSVIVPIPSSQANYHNHGVVKLAKRVAQLTGAVDGSACLVRTETIPRMRAGGIRCERIHFESIDVRDEALFVGKNVSLIDDITTSGASIRACKFLLLNAGAGSVMPIVLAKAVRKDLL